jgi:hypothetical protein
LYFYIRSFRNDSKFDFETVDITKDRAIISLKLENNLLKYKLCGVGPVADIRYAPLPLLADGYKNGLPIDVLNWIIGNCQEQIMISGTDRIYLTAQILVVLLNRNLLNKPDLACCCIPYYKELGFLEGAVYCYTLKNYINSFAQNTKSSSQIGIHDYSMNPMV